MSALAQKQFLVAQVAAKKNGTAVSLTLDSPGTYASDGTWSGATTTTMTGTVQRAQGDPTRYEELGLVESEAPTFVFTPDTFGDIPSLLMSFPLGGDTFVIRSVNAWAPDGNGISSSIVAAR